MIVLRGGMNEVRIISGIPSGMVLPIRPLQGTYMLRADCQLSLDQVLHESLPPSDSASLR